MTAYALHGKMDSYHQLQYMGGMLATLKLREKAIYCSTDEICTERVLNYDDDDFKLFRKRFYYFQFEFAIRSKSSNKRDLVAFRKLARDKFYAEIFGVTGNMLTLVSKFHIDLYVDFAISKRKSKEIFERTSKEVWAKIESFYIETGSENMVLNDYPLTSNGKKVDTNRLFDVWDKSLKVYDLYEKQDKKNYAMISREMGWFNVSDRHHCSDEVKKYLDYARRMIDAASKLNLYKEACKPLTIGKKRK